MKDMTVELCNMLGQAMAVCHAVINNGAHTTIVKQQAVEVLQEFADWQVNHKKWQGDHCGYLAEQANSRRQWGVEPTAEQQEAWNVCNITNADMETF